MGAEEGKRHLPCRVQIYYFQSAGDLVKRDAIGVWDASEITIDIVSNAELSLIDVPMNVSGN